MSFGARATISTDALRHNLKTVRKAAVHCKIMAVVKANAYGHGLETVGSALQDADALAVARLVEALRLRQVGVDKPIVLLEGVWDLDDQTTAISHNCELVIHDESQISLLESHAGAAVTVWLKVDTGMTRLGFMPEEANSALARLRSLSCVRDIRLMTHLSCAEDAESPKTQTQLQRFSSVSRNFSGDISIANSAAIFGVPDIQTLKSAWNYTGDQWVRPGIALYGVSPFDGQTGKELGLRPAMEFHARLIATKTVKAGTAVGYRETWVTPKKTQIGVLAVGYGDGYSRHLKNGTPVLLNGRHVPLIGRVSMDMITVDLGSTAVDQVGDVATLWGAELPVETVAAFASALPYTFVTGVMHRETV